MVETTNKKISKGENSIGNKNEKNMKIDKLSESKFVQKANERKSKEKTNQKEKIFRHYAEGKISTYFKSRDYSNSTLLFDERLCSLTHETYKIPMKLNNVCYLISHYILY